MGVCETQIRKFNEPYHRWPWQSLLKQLEEVLGDTPHHEHTEV